MFRVHQETDVIGGGLDVLHPDPLTHINMSVIETKVWTWRE